MARRKKEPFENRTVRGSQLDTVEYTRELIERAENDFVAAIKEAKRHGCTVREIQEAAGYKSPGSIQKILNK